MRHKHLILHMMIGKQSLVLKFTLNSIQNPNYLVRLPIALEMNPIQILQKYARDNQALYLF